MSDDRNESAEPIGSQFVVFVDGMDGDVYPDWIAMTHGVTHAFKHGAEEVTIKKYPTSNTSGQPRLAQKRKP